MKKRLLIDVLLLGGLLACASALRADDLPPALTAPVSSERIFVGVGKTHMIDFPANLQRVASALPEIAEGVPVSARSIMLNGKAAGETSLVVWMTDGTRRVFDISVRVGAEKIEMAEAQLEREFGKDVSITFDTQNVYLSGRVKDLYAASRAVGIAETVGKVVNLLRVDIPPQEEQVLLKVRFANVDRSFSRDLGANLFGNPGGYPASATVGSYSPTRIASVDSTGGKSAISFNLSDSLNLLLFDPKLNVGTTIRALENKNVLEILAEPNVLAMNGHEASFLSGGEFPFPVVSSAGGAGGVSISFREFGVRIRFLPTVTPRGSIQLHVSPEVSSLDYANSLTISGYTVPAISTRKVETDIELVSGQSFAIAGLLDNRTQESLSKIPGLANIPLFGKLFQTKSVSKSNAELLIIVTPELVAPIPEGKQLPDIERPVPFLEAPGISKNVPRTPDVNETGPAPTKPRKSELPVQEMQQMMYRQQMMQFQAPSIDTSLTQPNSGQTAGAGSGGATGGAGAGAGGTSGTGGSAVTIKK